MDGIAILVEFHGKPELHFLQIAVSTPALIGNKCNCSLRRSRLFGFMQKTICLGAVIETHQGLLQNTFGYTKRKAYENHSEIAPDSQPP